MATICAIYWWSCALHCFGIKLSIRFLMKGHMFKVIGFIGLAVFLVNTGYAQNDQMVLDGGIGVFNSGKKSLSETKMLSLGIQEDVWGPLKQRVVAGGWLDNAGGGRTSSAFASGQIGFEVNGNGLVAGIFTGPAFISSPDILLGGHLQFMDDIHFGIQDKESNYMGLMYRHLSSAGLEMPNIGRDVLGLEIRFPF